MTHSIGANIYGFAIGGLLFCLQLSAFGTFEFFTKQHDLDAWKLFPWLIPALAAVFFILAVLFWLTSICIVFPASLVFRLIPMPRPIGSMIGGGVGYLICWHILDDSLRWQLYLACISSSTVTGLVTGFMLAHLFMPLEIKPETATPRNLSV